MKKFMSMLMLVVLAITLSACGNKQLKGDFTIEVNNFVNTPYDNEESDVNQKTEITADINIINNTKYYVTNYPIVYWLIDENGDPIGKDGFYNVGTINLGPKGEVNFPFSLSMSNSYYSDEAEHTEKLKSFSSATDIKISTLTYEMLKPIGEIEAEESREFNEYMGIEEDYTDGLINMSQETFDNTLSSHLSTEPKHLGGAPTIFYQSSETPITPIIQVKKDQNNPYSMDDQVSISAEFTNDTDYLINVATMSGILDVKEGDKTIKRIYLSKTSCEDCETIKPGATTTLSVESMSNNIGKDDMSNKINSYTYQLIFVPTITFLGLL